MMVKRANRWSLAFADLSLLMLGFVVLSFVRPGNLSDESENEAPTKTFEWTTASLFESNEAMLSSNGEDKVMLVIGSLNARSGEVKLTIAGSAQASARLDEWELSAARMASFARSLKANGLDGSAIIFGEQHQTNTETPQQLIISIHYR